MNLSYYLLMSKLLAPITWIVFIFGAAVGSFLNVVICRVPNGTFFKLPGKSYTESQRSYCTHCNTLIPIYLNIPIVGYLILRGKTRCCGQKLSIQYPLVEAFTAIMAVVIYWHFPFLSGSPGNWQFDPTELLLFSHAALFVTLMIACSVIDIHHMIIPDSISIPMIVVSPLIAVLHPGLDIFSSVAGVILGGGSLYLVAWMYYLLRKQEGMGFGDVKLLAAIGGWLGYQAILPTILYSSTTGAILGLVLIVVKGRTFQAQLPFGPFLAAGATVHLLFGHIFQEWLFLPN